jgi:hypothetical protein
MNAEAEFDPPVLRHARVALDHCVLDLDGASHGVGDAAELDECAVAGALDHAPLMNGDGRIDQVAAQGPEPRQRAIFVGAGKPAEADDIGGQDCRDFPVLDHASSRESSALMTKMERELSTA